MRRKIANLSMAVLILVNLVTPAYATALEGGATEPKTVPVTLTSEPMQFSVTVPTSLPVSVSANGEVTTSSKAQITNNSIGPVEVTNVSVECLNNWSLITYGTKMNSSKVGLKQIGFKLNNDTTSSSDLVFNQSNWGVINGNAKLQLNYDATLAPQSTAINEEIANVVFTLGWHSASDGPKLTGITTEKSLFFVGMGETYTIKVYAKYDDNTEKMIQGDKVTWVSSNPTAVSIDSSGTVTRLNSGYAIISISFGGCAASCAIGTPQA